MILNKIQIKKICLTILNRWDFDKSKINIVLEIIDLLVSGNQYKGVKTKNSLEFAFPVFHRGSFKALKFYSFNFYSQVAPSMTYRYLHKKRIRSLKKILCLLKEENMINKNHFSSGEKLLSILINDITPVNLGIEIKPDGHFRFKIYGNFHEGVIRFLNHESNPLEGKTRQLANMDEILNFLNFDSQLIKEKLDLDNQLICFNSIGFSHKMPLIFKIYLSYKITHLNFPSLMNSNSKRFKWQIELIRSFSKDLLIGIEFVKIKGKTMSITDIEMYGFPRTKNIKSDLNLIHRLMNKYKFSKYYQDIVDYYFLLNEKQNNFPLFVVGLNKDNIDFGFNSDRRIKGIFI